MNDKNSKPEDRAIAAVEKVAGIADRYGVPLVTFAVGTVALLIPASGKVAEILPWLGTGLIIAALLTYIWQTWRSTTRVQSTPPSIPTEFIVLMNQLLEKIDEKDKWQNDIIGKLIDDLREKKHIQPISPINRRGVEIGRQVTGRGSKKYSPPSRMGELISDKKE